MNSCGRLCPAVSAANRAKEGLVDDARLREGPDEVRELGGREPQSVGSAICCFENPAWARNEESSQISVKIRMREIHVGEVMFLEIKSILQSRMQTMHLLEVMQTPLLET